MHGAAKEKGISSVPQIFLALAVVLPPGNRYTYLCLCVSIRGASAKKNKTKMGKELRTKSYIHFGRETAMVFLARGGLSRKKEK